MPLSKKRKLEVSIAADQLRSELGDDADKFPINLDALAKHLNYNVFVFHPTKEHLKNISGAVDHAKKNILINATDVLKRQFFTLAHEIGHIVLHKDETIVDYRDADTQFSDKEQEANLFAAELTMPEGKFYENWNQNEGDLEYLSSLFGVTVAAVKTRANWLNLR